MIIIHDSTFPRGFFAASISKNILSSFVILLILIGSSLPAPAAERTSVSVLCYHAFRDNKKDPFCFTLDELNFHIVKLKQEGFKFVSAGDVFNYRIEGVKNILLTVDDGNKSIYEAYWNVLKSNGIRPLLSIYPNIIGKKKYALTWEQLRELAEAGCDIAAHGYFHLKINKRLFDENPEYFRMEIYESKKLLEKKLGRKVDMFVYPFGLGTTIAMEALKHAGYRYAFTIDRGQVNIPILPGESYSLPRYMVTKGTWKYCFNNIIKNARSKAPIKVARANEFQNEKLYQEQLVREQKLVYEQLVKMEDDTVSPLEAVPAGKNRISVAADTIIAREKSIEPAQPLSREVSYAGLSHVWNASPMQKGGIYTPLNAKAETAMAGYYAAIKKKYYSLMHESYVDYNDLLSLVRGKISRIKSKIRQYVIGNF